MKALEIFEIKIFINLDIDIVQTNTQSNDKWFQGIYPILTSIIHITYIVHIISQNLSMEIGRLFNTHYNRGKITC